MAPVVFPSILKFKLSNLLLSVLEEKSSLLLYAGNYFNLLWNSIVHSKASLFARINQKSINAFKNSIKASLCFEYGLLYFTKKECI